MSAAKDKELAAAALASMSMRKLRGTEDFWSSPAAHALRIEGAPAVFWVVQRAQEAKQAKDANKRLVALNILSWLLERGLPIDQPHLNQTPLMEAAGMGDLAVARRLVQAGAQLEKRSPIGNTALHWAAIGGRPGVCKFLVAAGADLEALNHSRRTPLHCAADSLRMNTITVLHEAGADWDKKDVHDRTPLDVIRHRDEALALLWAKRPERDRLARAVEAVASEAPKKRPRL